MRRKSRKNGCCVPGAEIWMINDGNKGKEALGS
jgi:hypothetical protein